MYAIPPERDAVLSGGPPPPSGAEGASAGLMGLESVGAPVLTWTDGMIAPGSLDGHRILSGLNLPEVPLASTGAVPPATQKTWDWTSPTCGEDWLELACFNLMTPVGSAEPYSFRQERIAAITLTEPTPMGTNDTAIDVEALMSAFRTKNPPEVSPEDESEAILGLYSVLLSEPQQPQSIETMNTPHSRLPDPTSAEVLPSAPEVNPAHFQVPRLSPVRHSVQANADRPIRVVNRSVRKDKRHRWLHDRDCGLDPARRAIERVHKQNQIAMNQLSLLKRCKSRKWNTGESSTGPASIQQAQPPAKSDQAARKGPDGTQAGHADTGTVCIFQLRKRAFDPSQIPADFVDLTQEDD